jgi:cyclophilin family peptidyl-prolyl cis-trans isomerase
MHQKHIGYLLLSTLIILGAGCSNTPPPQTDSYNNTLSAEEIFGERPDTSVPTPTTISPTNTNTNSSTEKTMEFNASTQYTAILYTTKGEIEIEFNVGQTPNTVKNFVELARKNFYDGTIFHRAINGFMIQGGDPKGNGMGGPGYRFDDEPFTGEYTRGTVAMANSGPNTNGSQFFIMHADYPLQKNYTIFGKVIRGMDVVDAIATDDVKMSPSRELSQPVNPTTIEKVEIQEKAQK